MAGLVPIEEFIGNLSADLAAGLAANAGPNLKRAKMWEEAGVGIAKRLAVLEAARWSSGPRMVAPLVQLEAHEPFDPAEQIDQAIPIDHDQCDQCAPPHAVSPANAM